MSDDTQDLQDLDKKIKAMTPAPKEQSEVAKTLNAGMDFTAPILGGIFIGYMLDNWLNTQPAFIIGMLLLGVAAGISNIYKASQNIGSAVGYSELHQREKNAKTSPSLDSGAPESSEDVK
jgi:F0F1-type ATP synthase assembly protein I